MRAESIVRLEVGRLEHIGEIIDDIVDYSPHFTSNSKIDLFHEISLLLFIFPVIICINIETHPFFKCIGVHLNKKLFILFSDKQSKIVCMCECP